MNDKSVIHVVDDDPAMRDSLTFLLDVNGFAPLAYDSANAFLSGAAIRLPTLMAKTGARNMSALMRIALTAGL